MSNRGLGLVVEPEWLARHLDEPDLRIIDASWYLPENERDAQAEYEQGHLPGAIRLDLSTDLADTAAPVRNTVAPPERLAEVFGAAGIGPDHRVVVYDRLGGFSAGRVWWCLRYAGHECAGLLNGGFTRWVHDRKPITDRIPRPPPAEFAKPPATRWICDRDTVLRSLGESGAIIVDARSPERFAGEGPEPARYKGHIPGARNVHYKLNLIGDPPAFREPPALLELYEEAGVRFDRPVITTCGSGVSASLTAFVLTWLGHPEVSVYDGAWAEWGNTDGLPIEEGAPA
ncbi:MAG: sulfurtransferase [Myxococcota bacterium]